ncbi:protein HEAT INTOLERANT 4-like isoform X1 [Actinidia eriantha]|uniref:protein HEAT INTOLERANT 4-like isoform X1 n=1 Tax=Actinidia eriantha TaxID=165200 RepID=UPI0025852E50|nr:protein HEAT INTOLERANT 4-like isoform X1 [Actinidia eriantha]
MRRKASSKRKLSKKEEDKSAEETSVKESTVEEAKEESRKAGRKAKRPKASKPESEPEFFPDKRNLEDLWQQVFPVGTEWDQLDLVYQYKWNFSNLENAFEEGGELHGQKVYLFGCTEPQLVFFKGEGKVTCIPVVVAVVSPFPPSDKIGINSVQREAEEIVPMKQMKMDWVPYIPLENRDSQVERLNSQIFILSCTQRRAGLRHMKIDRVKKFEYCLPYFYQPLQEDELEQSTIVQILFPAEPPVFCEFDWELDELEEFADNLVKEDLAEDQKDAFKDFVKEKVREAKKANREAREARKKALQEMSDETKAAFQNMKFYKFYPVPTPDTPDVSNVKSPFINRYYGKAHVVL